jgi:hypothetical protein
MSCRNWATVCLSGDLDRPHLNLVDATVCLTKSDDEGSPPRWAPFSAGLARVWRAASVLGPGTGPRPER